MANEIHPDVQQNALQTGRQIVLVICDDPQLSISLVTENLPRVGEGMTLDDGTECEVVHVGHVVTKRGNVHESIVGVKVERLPPD